MQRVGNARFAGFARNVYVHAEFRAQSSSLDKRGDPTQLDRLQADAARRLALMMPPDVLERFLEQPVAAADLALVGIGGNEHAFAQQPADFARARGILLRGASTPTLIL
jgi:hypothetical protein